MRSLLTWVVILIAGYGVICLLLFLLQEKLIFFPERLRQDYAFSFPHPYEELHWSADGATLHALQFRAEKVAAGGNEFPQGVVLYFHGNAGSLRDWGWVAGQFLDLGYDVIIPDYRGYGKSSGRITGQQMLLDDGERAYQFLLQEYDEAEIVLYGRSIGSGIAIHLAAYHSPRLLILEAPFYTLRDLAGRQMPWAPRFLLKYPFPNARWIEEVRCPVILFHGTDDEVIPFDSSVRLQAHISSSHRLIAVEGGRHNNLDQFPRYKQELRRLLIAE